MATLYLVSTPIGNLGDLSPRAAETLCSVQRILAEDTRRTRVLADHVGAGAPMVSLHAHNERERVDRVLGWLESGEDLALVSDAGTPLVSDPGDRLVQAVTDAGHAVVPIPGPSAVLAALVGSGLGGVPFTFLGFVPKKGRERTALLDRVRDTSETTVLFESPQRLVRLLEDLEGVCGPDRRVAVARELTKVHEEFRRGTLPEVARYYGGRPPKGEVTVVVEPASTDTSDEAVEAQARALAEELLGSGMRASEVAREVGNRLDVARNEAYRMVLDLEGTETNE